MRYRIPFLMLCIVMVPVMSALAAPAPAPSAILDIGPPPKDKTAEQHREWEISCLTCHPMLSMLWSDPQVRKLPSIVARKDPRLWLAKNFRITWEGKGNRLRLTFPAGTREEQVTILNTLLRINLRLEANRIQDHVQGLRREEKCILELEKRIESEKNPSWVDTYRKGINDLRCKQIPARRTMIARLKQITVLRWAK